MPDFDKSELGTICCALCSDANRQYVAGNYAISASLWDIVAKIEDSLGKREEAIQSRKIAVSCWKSARAAKTS